MEIIYNDYSSSDDENKQTPTWLMEKLKLKEEMPDKDYRIYYLSDEDKLAIEKIRKEYGDRGYYPIQWQELRRTIFAIYKALWDVKLHSADLTRIVRVFWRAGEFRRFIHNKLYKYDRVNPRTGRKHSYGIHYILYPKHRSLDNSKLIEIDWELKTFDYSESKRAAQRKIRARKKEERLAAKSKTDN